MSAAKLLAANLTLLLSLLVLVLLLALVLLCGLLRKKKKQEHVTRRKTNARADITESRSKQKISSSPERGEFEKILDFVLRNMSQSLAQHCAQLVVPDIKQSFPVSWGIFQMQCNLSAKRGVVGDISSMFRDGPARVYEATGEDLILDTAVGLRNIQLRYDDYYLASGIFSVSGSLQVNAAPVSLRMRVVLRPPFIVELQSLSVENLGPVKLKVTGLGWFSSLLPFAENWINNNAFTIQDIALQHISHAVKDTLQSLSKKMETIPEMIFSQSASVKASPQPIAIEEAIEQYKREQVKIERIYGIVKMLDENTHVFDSCILPVRRRRDHHVRPIYK